MKINKRKSKGITLISLVITVIILIILAGISLNVLFGNDGIISRAKLAKDKYTNSANEEEENLKNVESLFSKILVGSDSTVELSMEQLNEYIDQRVNSKLLTLQAQIGEMEDDEPSLKNQIDNLRRKYKAGTVQIDTFAGGTSFSENVTFTTEEFDNNNYIVVASMTGGSVNYWGNIRILISNKRTNGFTINYRADGVATSNTAGPININWIAVEITD